MLESVLFVLVVSVHSYESRRGEERYGGVSRSTDLGGYKAQETCFWRIWGEPTN